MPEISYILIGQFEGVCMEEHSKLMIKIILTGVCLVFIAAAAVLLLCDHSNSAYESIDTSLEITTDTSSEITTDIPSETTTDTTPPITDTDSSSDTTEPITSAPPETEPPCEYLYVTDVSGYLEYIDPKSKEYLVLANHDHALGALHYPNDLIDLNGYGNVTLRSTAAKAFEAMCHEMEALGMADSIVASSFRDYEYQYKLYEKYVKQELARHPGYTREQAEAIVDTYSARPGTSDHQTGLTVDYYPVSNSFENTKTFEFLSENAYKFGFILRFPKGKSDITGYMYEPWHWRFVGRTAATEIYERGITLEEYLGMVD